MDSATYTALTGKTVTGSQTTRFTMQKKVTQKALERILGYPLCPDDWGNQYLEIGKTDGCFCSITDETELDDPDDVVNAYRIYRWDPRDVNIEIDPATEIHAVKLVTARSITVKTFEEDDYRPQWVNDREQTPYAMYLNIGGDYPPRTHGCWWHQNEGLLVAVDADWAFDPMPLEFKQVWADLIAYGLDDKRDIRSESAGTHSYSRFSQANPMTTHAAVLSEYSGPNGQGGDVGIL